MSAETGGAGAGVSLVGTTGTWALENLDVTGTTGAEGIVASNAGTLAFAAGAMVYVVVDELIPESQQGGHADTATFATMVGFTIMMVLDVALG